MGQTEAVDTTPATAPGVGFEVEMEEGVAVAAGRLVRSFEHLHRNLIVD